MSRTRTSIYRITTIVLLGIFLFGGVRAQLVSDAFCKEVENSLISPLRPAHWYRNITFDDSCDFEFDIDAKGGIGASLEIQRFRSERDARRNFKNQLEMFDHGMERWKNGEFLGFVPRLTGMADRYWDEGIIYLDGKPLVMLRKKRTVVTMFCDQQMLCRRFENLLATKPTYFIE